MNDTMTPTEKAKAALTRILDEMSDLRPKLPKNLVTPEMVEDAIDNWSFHNPPNAPHCTICTLVMKNGYVIVESGVPADPNNFIKELGREWAFKRAFAKVYPLLGYDLRNKLALEEARGKTVSE